MNNELDALERDVDDANGCIPLAALSMSEIIKTVIAYISRDARCSGIVGIVPAEEVKGQWQKCDCELFDHEFVDQHAYWEDDFHGTTFLPIGNAEYLAVEYSSH